MTIDFKKIELDEDSAAALAILTGNEAFTSYVASAVTNREEAVRQTSQSDVAAQKLKVDEFRQNNLTLKEQLEKFDGFDADDYNRLKALGSGANAAGEKIKALELQHQGQMDGVLSENASLKTANGELTQKNQDDEFGFSAMHAISKHNSKYPGVSVQEGGAEKILIEKMMQSRKVIDGKTVMLDNGREFTTDAGIGSLEDWINSVGRREFAFLYKTPVGGGASGSSDGGAGSKQMTRSEFDAINDPARRAVIARTYTITDA
jgi:hypothetical protein